MTKTVEIKMDDIQQYGINNAVWLGYLRANRKCTVRQIARAFSLYESSTRNRLEYLEKIGLIRRYFDNAGNGGRPAMVEVEVLC